MMAKSCQLFLLIKLYWNSQAHSFCYSLWPFMLKGQSPCNRDWMGYKAENTDHAAFCRKGLPVPCSHQFGHGILELWVCWKREQATIFLFPSPSQSSSATSWTGCCFATPLTLYDRSFPLLGIMIPLPFSSATGNNSDARKWKVGGSESVAL